jgi:hypothetical protein
MGWGAALLAGSALAAPTAQWELAVIARGPGGLLSPNGSAIIGSPAIDRDRRSQAWQVAFATSQPGMWADGTLFLPGVHLQEMGGAHKTLVKHLDAVPGGPGLVYCFDQGSCMVDADHVSLSQGEVAFKAQVGNTLQANALTGIFTINGAGTTRRIADTQTPMPGYPSATFGTFNSPSLSEGRIVFRATGGTPAMQGIYGDLGQGLGVVSDLNSVPLGVAADFFRFTDFELYPTVSRTYFNVDEAVVAFDATGDSRNEPGVRIEGILERYFSNGIGGTWSGVAIARPDQLQGYSPAVDFGGGVAYLSKGSAVYRGGLTSIPVASTSILVPGESAPFRSLYPWPAADAAPRQPGMSTMERWTAFVGNSPTTGDGVYLGYQQINVPNPASTLEKVADAPALWRLVAPLVGATAADPMPPITANVFHQGVKDGVVAFTVTVAGPWSADFVVVASKTTPTLMLKADADTYVRADLGVRQNDNYGMQDYIEVGTGRADVGQSEGAADKMRALVHFNTGVLPKLRLNSATLETTLLSYDNGAAGSTYVIGAHRVSTPWGLPAGEGNGFEGNRPPGAPPTLTDPDTAAGVAWRGGAQNPDPFAANNLSQPAFDTYAQATQVVKQQTQARGDKLQWDITPTVRGWLDGTFGNNGIALTDETGDVLFRGLRMGSREGEAYGLPWAVNGPRLLLRWTLGVMPGDFTGNGCVDRDDLALLLAVTRGQAEPGAELATRLDVNGDGKIDIADARRLATMFSRPAGAPCPQ